MRMRRDTRRCGNKLMDNVYAIGFIPEVDRKEDVVSEEPCAATALAKMNVLERILKCPSEKMGSIAAGAIEGALQHWQSVYVGAPHGQWFCQP